MHRAKTGKLYCVATAERENRVDVSCLLAFRANETRAYINQLNKQIAYVLINQQTTKTALTKIANGIENFKGVGDNPYLHANLACKHPDLSVPDSQPALRAAT